LLVCLTIPPSGFLIDERVFPSLGVLKVAAALEAAGHPVHVLDLSGVADIEAAVTAHRCGAEVYGITATMPQMPAAAKVAKFLRPRGRLILGGPHVTLLQASARQESVDGRSRKMLAELLGLFDALVAGDGERAVFRALKEDGIIDADDPKSEFWLSKGDLNDAPLPTRHLIDMDSYRYQIDGAKTCSLISQLGCPFGCAFCGGRRSPFLRRIRTRNTEAVLAEMRHLHDRYGAMGYMFLDDELNVSPAFPELLRGIIKLRKDLGDIKLRGLLKSELLTPEHADLMAEAGFRQILVGFESGDERMLLNMQKRATRAQNTRCVELLRGAGITVKALMSIGHAGESGASVAATRDWLLEVRPDDFDVTIITVYPGTPYYDDAIETALGVWTYTAKNGDRLHAQQINHLKDVNFYKGIPNAYQSFVWTDHLSREDLVRLRDETEEACRAQLGIAYPTAVGRDYEHSMGMSA
jgi:radical SAM superfamily enzyme YgiQ (UPF0313 family)